MRIEGCHILLTGASSGLGAALAKELQSRGARLALVSRKSEIAADLTQEADRRMAVERALDELGHVDVLINNAGIGSYAPSWQTPPEDLRQMFELNFFAAVELTRMLAPPMVQRGRGMIVNVASIASRMTLPWFTLYSASKSALDSFSRGLRMELMRTGVGVMVVCPGYIKTGFQQNVLSGRPPEKLAHKKRFASTPEAVARSIADGMEADKRTVMVPASGWVLAAASQLTPTTVDRRLRAMMDESG